MTRYRLSREAKRDLDEIFDDVAGEGGVYVAERLIDDLTNRFLLLGRHPEAGRARDEIEPGLRSFPVGHDLIYYRATEREIDIARVLHGARDSMKSFRTEE
jgi:toxin ParE1/3/4